MRKELMRGAFFTTRDQRSSRRPSLRARISRQRAHGWVEVVEMTATRTRAAAVVACSALIRGFSARRS